MDPSTLTQEQWAQVGYMLKFLWGALGCAIIAGLSFVTAHAMIPSAVATRHIPERFEKLRAPLYATGSLGLLGMAVTLYFASQQIDWLFDMWPRWWQ